MPSEAQVQLFQLVNQWPANASLDSLEARIRKSTPGKSQEVLDQTLIQLFIAQLQGLRSNEYRPAITNMYQSLVVFEKNKHTGLQCMSQYEIARFNNETGHFYQSALGLKEAGELARALEWVQMLVLINLEFARLYDKVNRNPDAIRFYVRAFRNGLKSNSEAQTAQAALALGRLYNQNSQGDSARHYLAYAQKYYTNRKIMPQVNACLIEEGVAHLQENGSLEKFSAFKYLQEQMNIEKDDLVQIRYRWFLGYYELKMGHPKEARNHFESAIQYSIDKKIKSQELLCRAAIADVYYHQQMHKEAFEYLKSIGHVNMMPELWSKSSLADDITKNSEIVIRDQEIQHLKIQNQLKQEVIQNELQLKQSLSRENVLIQAQLEKDHLIHTALQREQVWQSEQLQQEKALSNSLTTQNELMESNLLAERKMKWILGVLLALGLVFGGIIGWMYRLQRKKSATITKLVQDLEYVNKEVHHRVKNNLQVISSLLDLQTMHVHDEQLRAVIQESKQRVQSMAFIHQNLYENEDAREVNIQRYLNHLGDHLMAAYGKTTSTVKMEFDVSPLKLHMDTVIPIGLIVNELVTNALKYAFQAGQQGHIVIGLNQEGNALRLFVRDDGKGMGEDWVERTSNTFGYRIIRTFAQKLKATLHIHHQSGTDIQLLIHKFKTL
jgi:two-component sensor histidine kinase